jgi:Protein of unknown function (DUF2800).
MPDKHAILAPSASKRWMTCAPSARAEEGCPERTTGFAEEGTIAHAAAERMLTLAKAEGDVRGDALHYMGDPEIKALAAKAEGLGLDFGELIETVHDKYVGVVWDSFRAAQALDLHAILLIEARIDLSSFVPESFGSSDAIILHDDEDGQGVMECFDLKYGKGVKVEAEGNTQLRCYALGALYGAAEAYAVKIVKMTIIQPRLSHYSTATMSYEGLLAWGQFILRPAAKKAFAGEGDYVAGDHCKFCRFAPRCRAALVRAKVLSSMTDHPEGLTDDELADVLKDVESIKSWAARFEEYALNEALNGRSFPGWKLVEGRSISKINDQQGAIAVLHDNGFADETILKPRELKTITDLKKVLRAKAFDDLLSAFVVRPAGKPTLVPASDRRPALADAKEEFKDLIS